MTNAAELRQHLIRVHGMHHTAAHGKLPRLTRVHDAQHKYFAPKVAHTHEEVTCV